MSISTITAGMVITAPIFPEPVKVMNVRHIGIDKIKLEAIGQNTRMYYDPILGPEELSQIKIPQEKTFSFTGDAEDVFLYLEANRIRNAFQFDALYGISVSQVDPLPHQIERRLSLYPPKPTDPFSFGRRSGAAKP